MLAGLLKSEVVVNVSIKIVNITMVYFTKILENNKKLKYNLFVLTIVQFLRRKNLWKKE